MLYPSVLFGMVMAAMLSVYATGEARALTSQLLQRQTLDLPFASLASERAFMNKLGRRRAISVITMVCAFASLALLLYMLIQRVPLI